MQLLVLREADSAKQSTVQVPFDRSWATLNVFGYTVLYIVLALNC